MRSNTGRPRAVIVFRRPMMHGNQRAMIANQVQELQKLVAQFETVRNQLTAVTDSVQGRVGSITAPMAELVATPTDLLHTTRAWHSDFTGQAGSMVDSLRGLAATRRVLQPELARRVASGGYRDRGGYSEYLSERG